MRMEYVPTGVTFSGMADRVTAAAHLMQSDDTPMRQVATFLDQWVQRNFKTQGGLAGGWSPFKYGGRVTVKRKADAKSIEGRHWVDASAKLEMHTGVLRASFLPFCGAGRAGIGSDLPYSKYQNDGTRVLPVRKLLMEQADVEVDITEILDAWVMATVNKL